MSYLGRQRVPMNVRLDLADKCWQAAWRAVVTVGAPLNKAGLTAGYLKQEVEWVIRGRALPDLASYLALERSGRGTPLSRELRTQVWQLADHYANELARRGVEPGYDAVIVDEAQDLTDAALRLLYALVGDKPDGLLLVGDGQQSIYPGGFNLSELGIHVRGRSHVLTRNYRNTREIYDAAQRLVRGHGFDDGGDRPESGVRTVEVSRSGPPPVVSADSSEEEHDLALAAAMHDALGDGTGIGDIAVLLPTNSMVKRYVDLIDSLGLPTQRLDEYDGTPNGLAKVGTYQRAKGLEFKRVFLPRLDPSGLHEHPLRGEDSETHAERVALIRRQLFVAMTRARDGLWLGWVGEPTGLLPPSLLDMLATPLPPS